MWSLLTLAFLGSVPRALAAGYCATNTFPTNTTWMQFTKEPVSFEYGFQNKFKSIHCCVKGYRSIECRNYPTMVSPGVISSAPARGSGDSWKRSPVSASAKHAHATYHYVGMYKCV
ncbi:unnamed protein product, partial [Iphiclides podalirius]